MIVGPLRLPLLVSIAIAIFAAGWTAWTSAEAARKMAAVDRTAAAAPLADVVLTLKFAPEAFHMTRAQELGQVVKTDGRRLYLRSADRSLVREYARAPWVERVDLWDGRQ